MIPQLAEPFDKLENQKTRFLEILAGCSARQLAFRQHPEAWTLVQVGLHVAIAEQRTADSIKRHRGMRSGSRSLRYGLGNVCLWLVLRTGIRVKNPVPETEPEPDIELPELIERWAFARTDLANVLSEIKPRGLSYAAFKHPIGGPYNVQQAMHFLVTHLQHHLRQVDRIRRDPAFPDDA